MILFCNTLIVVGISVSKNPILLTMLNVFVFGIWEEIGWLFLFKYYLPFGPLQSIVAASHKDYNYIDARRFIARQGVDVFLHGMIFLEA